MPFVYIFSFVGQPENGPLHDGRGPARARRLRCFHVGHGQVSGHENIVFVRRGTQESRVGRANAERPAHIVLRRDHDGTGQLFGRAHRQHPERDHADGQNRGVHHPPTGVRYIRQIRRCRTVDQRPVGVPRARVQGQTVVSKVRLA